MRNLPSRLAEDDSAGFQTLNPPWFQRGQAACAIRPCRPSFVYFPWNLGLRFSFQAAIPSCRSCEFFTAVII